MTQVYTEDQIVGRMKKLRTELHHKIVFHLRSIGLTDSETVIEHFKRWYLFDHHGVETSRALSIDGLEKAKKELFSICTADAIKGIMRKYSSYSSEKELLICTPGQVHKIYAVALGGLKMSKPQMFNYVDTTLARKTFSFNISMIEADKVIKRLEQFEVKSIRERRNEKTTRNS